MQPEHQVRAVVSQGSLASSLLERNDCLAVHSAAVRGLSNPVVRQKSIEEVESLARLSLIFCLVLESLWGLKAKKAFSCRSLHVGRGTLDTVQMPLEH